MGTKEILPGRVVGAKVESLLIVVGNFAFEALDLPLAEASCFFTSSNCLVSFSFSLARSALEFCASLSSREYRRRPF